MFKKIVAKIDAGDTLSKEDVVFLLTLNPFSEEANVINEMAFEIGFEAADGKMRVYGQIGLDDSVCRENCKYCSFAIDNFKANFTGLNVASAIKTHNSTAIISSESFIEYLGAFNIGQVNAVSLMGTATLPFDKFLSFVRTARAVLREDIGIIANYRDMTKEEVFALKEAGVSCVYHTVRIREGKITGIKPQKRRQTISYIKDSGLQLMNGVEPVWEPFDFELADDVADRIFEAVSQKPIATGVCGLCKVENSKFKGKRPSSERVQLIASVLRIVARKSIPIGCVGGVKWVDAGADPREREFADCKQRIINDVKAARDTLALQGWS